MRGNIPYYFLPIDENNTQRIFSAVAGNGAACNGFVDCFEACGVNGGSCCLDHVRIGFGMGDETNALIGIGIVVQYVTAVFCDDLGHFSLVFAVRFHFSFADDDFRAKF